MLSFINYRARNRTTPITGPMMRDIWHDSSSFLCGFLGPGMWTSDGFGVGFVGGSLFLNQVLVIYFEMFIDYIFKSN